MIASELATEGKLAVTKKERTPSNGLWNPNSTPSSQHSTSKSTTSSFSLVSARVLAARVLAARVASRAAAVSVAVDTRLGRRSWMDASWVDTGTQMVDNDARTAHFEVFRKSFGAGTVTLGPNAGSGSTYLMYVVAVTPAGGPPSPTPTPGGGCTHSGPVPGKPPGCNFDLSMWSLQLPTGQPGNPTTIPNTQLEAGFTDQYFFTGSDGAMDFVDPGTNCVTTPNSTHCRTELREVNPDGSDAVWSAGGTNTLSATLTVTDAAGAPVIGQIHLDPAISVRPLMELFYTTSGDVVAGVEQCTGGGCETRTTVGHVAPGTRFSYVIDYSHNHLTVSVDGVSTSLSSPILGDGGYFKAGDCGQAAANAAVDSTR
jgi:Alginate lyase